MDRVAPRLTKSRTESDEAKREIPITEIADPMRAKLRNANVEPTRAKSRSDNVDPKREKLLTDKEEPKLTKSRRDIVEPSLELP